MRRTGKWGCACVLLATLSARAQNYPKDFFRMPVDTVVRLAGNFGEIRYDHFHYGWDIRTGGKEGLRVVACGDGYISRIKAGPFGYGKVIYITHPNGYVTVYAHLSAFNDSIGAYVKRAQYQQESYEVELFPKPGELPVKKGEFIALSGNTGASEAPHLHFEIRDEKTEEIINPYLFGLTVPDNVKPFFKTLAVYPVDPMTSTAIDAEAEYHVAVKNGAGWSCASRDTVFANGMTAFGIECYDRETGGSGQNQVYSLEFKVDGKRIYYYEMNRFAFDQTLYVNCHIDYKAQRHDHKAIQRAFLLPGNKFPIYKDVINTGIVNFDSAGIHTGSFIATDFFGNRSEFTFTIFTGKYGHAKKPVNDPYLELKRELDCPYDLLNVPLKYNEETRYTDSGSCMVIVPPNSFYQDYFQAFCIDPYRSGVRKEKLRGTYSLVFRFPGKYVPLHKRYSLSLKVDTLLPDSLLSKLLIGMIEEKGFTSKGGTYSNGWVTTQTRSFGAFTVVMDTMAPRIKEPRLPKGNNIAALKLVEFKISDNLSGIKTYRVTIDGKWILFEYEPKRQSLFCRTSDLPAGKHTLKVVVTDEKNNQAVEWFTYMK